MKGVAYRSQQKPGRIIVNSRIIVVLLVVHLFKFQLFYPCFESAMLENGQGADNTASA